MSKKKENKGDKKINVVTLLNIILLLINVVAGIYNFRETHYKTSLLKNNFTQTSIDIAKEFPLFEIQYLQIEKGAFHTIASGKHASDSLYSDPLDNYYVAQNDILKINNDDYESEIVALAIKQIGGSMAKDVTVEYDCIYTGSGLSYFVTTGLDVSDLSDDTEDISGNKTTSKVISIRYGDLPTGRGLLLPLFQIKNVYEQEMNDDNGDEVWSKTGPVVLVPKFLSYKNAYNDEVTRVEIRKMNNSVITYSLFIEGRGILAPY